MHNLESKTTPMHIITLILFSNVTKIIQKDNKIYRFNKYLRLSKHDKGESEDSSHLVELTRHFCWWVRNPVSILNGDQTTHKIFSLGEKLNIMVTSE